MIRRERRAKEWSQASLAGRLGMSRATLANVETGRQRLLVHQLYAFAEALGTKPLEFLPASIDGADTHGWPDLRMDADVNPEQKRQIERLIGPLQPEPANKDGTDGKSEAKRRRRTRKQAPQ
jgi:transcriptional regulator with XRE-family HTH domain